MRPVEQTVAFLYSDRFVPPEALAFATGQVPPGFRLCPIEQGAAAGDRLAAFETADYVFAYPGDPCAAELAAASRLKLFQLLSAGHDWLALDVFRERGIPVASNAGANASTVSEHTILLMLALLRQLPRHDTALRRGEWLGMRHTMQLGELRGRTVGLVGFGNIGQEVARRLRGFDVRLQYAAPRPAPDSAGELLGAERVGFDELLATSDIVSLHAPLTAHTRGLIGQRALALLRPGSWLVNTARGALIDEDALVAALRGGTLAGAALDAFAIEPLPLDSPLLALDNVVLTPHIGGVSADTWTRRLALCWQNVQRVESGLSPLSRIV